LSHPIPLAGVRIQVLDDQLLGGQLRVVEVAALGLIFPELILALSAVRPLVKSILVSSIPVSAVQEVLEPLANPAALAVSSLELPQLAPLEVGVLLEANRNTCRLILQRHVVEPPWSVHRTFQEHIQEPKRFD
jgi:hypothetical protein